MTTSQPPADRAALRDRIADQAAEIERLRTMYDAATAREHDLIEERDELRAQANLDQLAEAMLPPSTDRAAVLREAINRLDADMERFFSEWPDEPRNSPYALGRKDAADLLRRMADEEQP